MIYRNQTDVWCIPQIPASSKMLIAQDLYHPLLPGGVANSIRLQGQSALISGSNMSGKTTFIRTVGINTLLGQTLNTCHAREFQLNPCRIFSSMRMADNLLNERSYYMQEVATMREILEASTAESACLVLIDELFKGTNTTERVASGKAVLSFLNQKEHLVFCSTHDLELTHYLENYSFYQFTEIIANNQLSFDFLLKSGKLTETNAIRILEIKGYPPEVTEEARRLAALLQIKNAPN